MRYRTRFSRKWHVESLLREIVKENYTCDRDRIAKEILENLAEDAWVVRLGGYLHRHVSMWFFAALLIRQYSTFSTEQLWDIGMLAYAGGFVLVELPHFSANVKGRLVNWWIKRLSTGANDKTKTSI